MFLVLLNVPKIDSEILIKWLRFFVKVRDKEKQVSTFSVYINDKKNIKYPTYI